MLNIEYRLLTVARFLCKPRLVLHDQPPKPPLHCLPSLRRTIYRHADTLGREARVEPAPAAAIPALPIVILLVFPSTRSPRCGLMCFSSRTLPPKCIRLACPGVKDLDPPVNESWIFIRADGGEHVMGGDLRRSALPRLCREMPLVELASGPE